jgi:tetraacyldisaccharide 4'-kinase
MLFSGVARHLSLIWYRPRMVPVLWLLLPLAWFFLLVVFFRRVLYRSAVLVAHRLPVPVIVVGNLTVGGSGKTPLVLWLVGRLRDAGWQPGIISRGYGGTGEGVRSVGVASQSSEVGDEPLLLARRSGMPVFVGRDRVAAGRALLAAHPACNVIVSDDGLQHYRLQRSVEVVVFDARGAGNGYLLPAGPLREPLHRLGTATAIIWNGRPESRVVRVARAVPGLSQFEMRLVDRCFLALADRKQCCAADVLRGKKLYAVAGIGDPARFFLQLEALGLQFEAHPFPDHHAYSAADLAFAHDGVLLMTEKDAVKCAALVLGEAWVLPVEASIKELPGNAGLLEIILEKLNGRSLA